MALAFVFWWWFFFSSLILITSCYDEEKPCPSVLTFRFFEIPTHDHSFAWTENKLHGSGWDAQESFAVSAICGKGKGGESYLRVREKGDLTTVNRDTGFDWEWNQRNRPGRGEPELSLLLGSRESLERNISEIWHWAFCASRSLLL